MSDIQFRFASISDKHAVEQLLTALDLPHNDIDQHLAHFILAESNKKLIGVIGVDAYGSIGLLRSLGVGEKNQKSGLGTALTSRMLAYARTLGIKKLYLLTLTAEHFFSNKNFTKIERSKVPDVIKSTTEFSSLCPGTAICFFKSIENEILHYPHDVLNMKPVVSGASMWAVSLTNTMFTYFEIEPNSSFEKHQHQNEQITYILEGELFFEFDNNTICAKKGDVITIPSNIFHAAYTKDKSVRAVDAWSPVMEKYNSARSTHK